MHSTVCCFYFPTYPFKYSTYAAPYRLSGISFCIIIPICMDSSTAKGFAIMLGGLDAVIHIHLRVVLHPLSALSQSRSLERAISSSLNSDMMLVTAAAT